MTDNTGKICLWFQSDAEAAARFYAETFPNSSVGKAQPGGDGSRWDFYIGVDDIDRAARAVEAGGGRLTGEIGQIPGGEYSVRVRDPQGAGFGLVGPRKENDHD